MRAMMVAYSEILEQRHYLRKAGAVRLVVRDWSAEAGRCDLLRTVRCTRAEDLVDVPGIVTGDEGFGCLDLVVTDPLD